MFELWAAFLGGPSEKCLNSYWWGGAKARLPLERQKGSPLQTNNYNFIMVTVFRTIQTLIQKASVVGYFWNANLCSVFYSFPSFLLQTQSQALCVSLTEVGVRCCQVESRAGTCFSCLWYKLKFLRDDVRRSGDAETPESYYGSIK